MLAFWSKWTLFLEIGIITGSIESKKRFVHNHGQNILEFYGVVVKFWLTTTKTKLDISLTWCLSNLISRSLVYELPHKLPNDVRRKMLRNKEFLEKAQIIKPLLSCPILLDFSILSQIFCAVL